MFSSVSGAAKLSLAVVIALIAIKVTVASITGSISIFAQALDSFLDLFAAIIIFFAVRVAAKPADEEHPFGHGKAEDIAATVQGLLIFVAAGLIVYFAIRRIITGTTVELTEAGVAAMAVSMVASIFLSRHLLRVSRATDSTALEANARNIAADVYSAAGVMAGLIVIRFTRLNILDPIIALIVAAFVLKAGFEVMRKSSGALADTRLPEEEESIIRSAITEHRCQLIDFHDLRTRKAGSHRYVDLHLTMPKDASVEEAHRVADRLEQSIKGRLPNVSISIHIEPCSTEECKQCSVSCTLRNKRG